jgi:hypothetical protein
MRKTYHGSCHCGAVQFECEVDLASAVTSRCNCSICMKTRFWKSLLPAADVRVLQGEGALTAYRFGSNTIGHMFCRTCGVKVFGRAHFDTVPFGDVTLDGDYVAINVAALNDATDDELASAKIIYENGRNNAWDKVPAETSYL